MNQKAIILYIEIVLLTSLLINCTKESSGLISSEQEIILGKYLDSLILENEENYPVLDTAVYKSSYQFIDTIIKSVTASSDISRKKIFQYSTRIVNNDEIDFFAFPGGYFYMNTGFLKYLENSSQLTGVIAHQVAHIDRRHLTGQIQEYVSIEDMLEVIYTGNKEKISQIFALLMNKPYQVIYSKSQEEEADEYAVKYTIDTKYDPLGFYYFLLKEKQSIREGNSPEFAEMHPVLNERTDNILQIWSDLDSIEGGLYTLPYSNFLQNLP